MKVLLINGSARPQGNTFLALSEVAKTLNRHDIETEIVQLGTMPVRGCIACNQCKMRELNRCVFDDDLCNRVVEKLAHADGLIIGSPTYYGQPNGALLALMQRVLYSASSYAVCKPAAAVAVCRRGGSTAAFQTMNMPFQMLNMPLVTSQYWNIVFGMLPGEASLDAEGMQTMRTLGQNMAWMLRKIHGGEGSDGYPEYEPTQFTHFIR